VEARDVAKTLLAFVNTDIMADGHAVQVDEPLEAAGVDSMAQLRIFLFIESEFGFWIPDEDLVPDNVGSVMALARYVSKRAPASASPS
jgi:acyl carrier protein